MINLNGDIFGALDVETTGLDVEVHDIVQVAVVPYDHNLEPIDINPFYMNMRPLNPERASKEAMEVNGLDLAQLACEPHPWDVADMFEEWFQQLKLPIHSKIIYVTQNGPFDIPYVKKWLGVEGFERYFRRRGRDTMFSAAVLNDQAAWKNRAMPFKRLGLKDLCAALGVELGNHHDALADCIATAKVYRELLRMGV